MPKSLEFAVNFAPLKPAIPAELEENDMLCLAWPTFLSTERLEGAVERIEELHKTYRRNTKRSLLRPLRMYQLLKEAQT